MAVKEDLRVSAKYKSRCSYFIINTQTKEKAKQMECFQIALEAISRSDVSRCLQMSPVLPFLMDISVPSALGGVSQINNSHPNEWRH